MNDPLIYGWCPGALRPMQSGDGWVVRIRPPLGRLTSEQAQRIAALAAEYGNGQIDLSARANLQLRGISPETHPPLITALQTEDLVDLSVEAEARRNIVLTPFWRDGDDSLRIAGALTALLAASDAPTLPEKFGFSVDCGAQPVLAAISADIRIERGDEGLLCRADGMNAGCPVTRDNAAETALAFARWFVESGGVHEKRGRMARHLADGASLPADWRRSPAAASAPRPGPGLCAQGGLVAVEFGRIDAATLTALAEIGPLRVTPWRMLLIEGAKSLPDLPGLILDAEDPRLRMEACTGAPACPQGRAETRSFARAMAHFVPTGARLHVSGCAKGCAHPRPLALTLVATDADHFDLIRDGTAADPPSRRSLTRNDLLKFGIR